MRILSALFLITTIASINASDLTTAHQHVFAAKVYGQKNNLIETYSTAIAKGATLTITYFHAGPHQGRYEESCRVGSRRNGGGWVERDRDLRAIEKDFKELQSLFLAAQAVQKPEEQK